VPSSPLNSIEALLPALYEAICFEPGTTPRLDQLRTLFAPEGRLIHVKPDNVEVMDVETFIARFEEQIRLLSLTSFHEREVAREIRQFGHVAQVFSTFEARSQAGDAVPFARGINSIQLLRREGRWFVASLMWDDERPDNPIPAEYLPKPAGD